MFESILAIVAFTLLVVLAFLNDRKKSNRYEEPEQEDILPLLGVVAPPQEDTPNKKTKGNKRA